MEEQIMIKYFNTLVFVMIFLTLSCSSKKEISLEEETAESLLEKSRAAYVKGDYDKTINYIDLMLNNFPTSDLHIDAQLLQAQTLGAKEEYEEQFDLLLRILKENIIPEKVPQIYMQIGEFYENSAKWNPMDVTSDTVDFQQAAKYYRKAVFYPNSDDRATKAAALYRAGLMYAKSKDFETAKIAYGQVIESFPESPYSTLARTKLLDPTNTEELPLEPALEVTATEMPVTPQPDTEEPAAVPIEPTLQDTTQFQLPPETSDEPIDLDSLNTAVPDTMNQ
jgi:tetratricopeptide (TPR) repeat protein